jgi:multisubunit Na+/H+ antiporter MnhB subunit
MRLARTLAAIKTGLILLLAGWLAFVLGGVVLDLPDEPRGLTALAAAHLEQSGVEHPVTAVLLNFRGYDTWLELGVLILAMLGVLCLRRQSDLCNIVPMPVSDPVLVWLVRWLVPVMIVLAGYLLWLGKFESGGAFQSGVVLSAAGVMLWLSGYRSVAALPPGWLRFLLLVGFFSFFLTAILLLGTGYRFLEYPPELAGPLIVLIETAAALSIGVVLAALFIGLQASQPETLPESGTHRPS